MTVLDPPPKANITPALRWFAAPLIALAIVYAYHNACKGPFVFDDDLVITNNPSVRTLWPLWVPMFPVAYIGTAGRPLVGLTYAMNFAIDGLNPRGYHAVNIAFHAIGALALWGVLRRTLRLRQHPANEALALAATLIWAVHPLLTDSVTYCANRSEVQMGCFLLLTLYTFLRAVESHRPARWFMLSVICAIAAAGSKEVATMTPLIVLLFDVLVVTGLWRATFRKRKWYYLALPLCSLVLPVTLLLGSFQSAAVIEQQDISPWRYLMMQSQIITQYLSLALWPSSLVVTYVDWPIPNSLADAWPWMLGIGGLFLATLYGVMRKHPWGMLGAWFFLILAPTSSILVILAEPGGERRMYLPLITIVVGVVLMVERLTRKLYFRAHLGAILLALLVLVLGQVTLARNEDFSSAIFLWLDTITKRPNNALAYAALGAELEKAGDYSNALKQFEKSIDRSPSYLKARAAHARTLGKMGHDDLAVAELKSILANDPNNALALVELGTVALREGHPADARRIWQDVVRRDPTNMRAMRLLQEASQQSP